ncbi:MAG TPA: hypothetical protein VMS76_02590 [Planctomycetota bacterium]|nr:hypothetical protein [Planctomycetota bacterium]
MGAGSILALALGALGQARTPAPPEDPWREFPIFVWVPGGTRASDDAGSRLEIVERFGGAQLMRGEDGAWAVERGLATFVHNAPGRDELHLERDDPRWRARWEAWYERRDVALLVRDPCLSEPETRARLARRLEESLGALPDRSCIGVSIGDEVSLTAARGPEDICLSPTCRSEWARFVERLPGLSDEERASLRDPATFSTDATRLALADGRTEALWGWLLRRRFHQEVLLGLLEELAGSARAAPGAGVGLLGIAGQSAFGGVAVERVLAWLDFAECYRTLDARELLFTLREPRQRALLTVFAEPGDPAGAAWQMWEHWLRGGDGLVLWSARELGRSQPLLERTARAARDLRAARALAPDFAPIPAGVAIVHDSDSVAAGWLRDALLDGATWPRRLQSWQEEHGTLERSLRAWLRLLEDCGLQPGAVPLEQVGARTLGRFPLLVLNHLLVLDEQDLARLEAFLRAGGTLCVGGDLGWIDSRGRRPARAPLERLREIAPERVHAAPAGLDGYLEARLRSGAPARAFRGAANALLDSAGVSRAPFTISADPEGLPWLCAWSEARGGGWVCAALPNAIDVPPRHLHDQRVEVVAPERFAVEWIHPADGNVLVAGDALVFRLRPSR